MLTVRGFDLTTFPNTEGCDELVLVEDIAVRSVCEHHMLPFVGVAHLNDQLSPLGVGVVIEAEHTCMSLRGVRAAGSPLRCSGRCGRTGPRVQSSSR
jgi:GTP cyclohydrolase I